MILKGNPEVNTVDVADQVASISFKGTRDSVNLRATYGNEPSFSGGNSTYECSIDTNQGVTADDLTMIFFEAIADEDGTITVSGSFKPGVVSATNPRFTGTALVTEFMIGGAINTEGTHAVTFPLLARPTMSVTP